MWYLSSRDMCVLSVCVHVCVRNCFLSEMESQRPLAQPHLCLLLCAPTSARLLPRLHPHPPPRTFPGSLQDAHCSAPGPTHQGISWAESGWGPSLVSKAAMGICRLGQPTTGVPLTLWPSVCEGSSRGQCDWALSLLAPLGARRQEPSPDFAGGSSSATLPAGVRSAVCVYVSTRVRAYTCGHVCCTHGCMPVFSGAPALRAAERL